MKDGFLKVAVCTPHLKVGDIFYNESEIKASMKEASEAGVKVLVFPELSITGYTCGDLFGQDLLIKEAKDSLMRLAEESGKYDGIFFVGLPFEFEGALYNVAAALCGGKVLGLVPKKYLPDYHEFYELRQFAPGFSEPREVQLDDKQSVYLGMNQLFSVKEMPKVQIACELCEDLWAPNPPSIMHALNGATVLVNLSASDEVVAKSAYRRQLVKSQSASTYSAYLYCSAGWEESTQDVVYSGHGMIAENGSILKESALFSNGMILSEIDVEDLCTMRRRNTTFVASAKEAKRDYVKVPFSLQQEECFLTRKVPVNPFVPAASADLKERTAEILDIQAVGLMRRLKHTGVEKVVLGISGGLDSTLALLVCERAYKRLGLPVSGIIGVTMPGFGTTDRTYENAKEMVKSLGATLMEIPIGEAVKVHFKDVGVSEDDRDVTYENCQARERTQILMDLANKKGALVIGTGDLSELALGWATYNGDHMSMYGVNASVPKTLVRHLVAFYADTLCEDGSKLQATLRDVLETPVSPELLPPTEGEISQRTEELVGPYELHDFFLYYMMRHGFAPSKIFRLAQYAFQGSYDSETILHWEKTFYRRFFAQQFKRSCLPDGPKVGSVALSPRGDWRMPSDAVAAVWLRDLEN